MGKVIKAAEGSVKDPTLITNYGKKMPVL